MKRIVLLLLLVSMQPLSADASQPSTRDIKLSTGTELTQQVWPGREGAVRILWLGSDVGFPSGMHKLASELSNKGIEVTQVDMLGALFLPALPSSLEQVPEQELAALLQHALASGPRELILMADGQGAKLLVRAAQAWRAENKQTWSSNITTTILISPNLYMKTPVAGTEATYIQASGALSGRVLVWQPQLSPLYWWLERLELELIRSLAKVKIMPLMGVRDRFYFRPDASAKEQVLAGQFADTIFQALEMTKEKVK